MACKARDRNGRRICNRTRHDVRGSDYCILHRCHYAPCRAQKNDLTTQYCGTHKCVACSNIAVGTRLCGPCNVRSLRPVNNQLQMPSSFGGGGLLRLGVPASTQQYSLDLGLGTDNSNNLVMRSSGLYEPTNFQTTGCAFCGSSSECAACSGCGLCAGNCRSYGCESDNYDWQSEGRANLARSNTFIYQPII